MWIREVKHDRNQIRNGSGRPSGKKEGQEKNGSNVMERIAFGDRGKLFEGMRG
jgi:hypothetical protein